MNCGLDSVNLNVFSIGEEIADTLLLHLVYELGFRNQSAISDGFQLGNRGLFGRLPDFCDKVNCPVVTV